MYQKGNNLDANLQLQIRFLKDQKKQSEIVLNIVLIEKKTQIKLARIIEHR